MAAPKSRLPAQVGRYGVLRLLGQGAMGRVLLAHDPVLDRDVAIKHLRTDLEITDEQRSALLKRMRQEARATARVSHPNLVALHDMGEDPEVGLFLVFEYVDGPTLKEELTRKGPLSSPVVARLARQLGGGLSVAHRAGVLHRDIKPENVILSETGAKIADFGIARLPNSTLTQGGSILGTPAYSAPEAIRDGKFSPRSDQFSLAAALYESLLGRRPFPGDDAVAVAARIQTDDPPQIAGLLGLSARVDDVLSQALSKASQDRFSDCEGFGRALSGALMPESRAEQATLPDARRRVRGRSTRWFGLAGAAAAAVLAGWIVWWQQGALEVTAASAPGSATYDEIPPVAWLSESPKPARTANREQNEVRRPGNPAGISSSPVREAP